MGMQIGPTLIETASVIGLCTAIEVYWVHRNRPTDTTGNGISIGLAKAFDNRSLAIRVERLNAGLETLKVVNQNLTENLSKFQEQTSSETSRSLTLTMKGGSAGGNEKADTRKPRGDAKDAASVPSDATADNRPNIGLASGDILNDQLNLASQIFNLQLLYERSLSDRMIGDHSRLQTVLGFQVSITPPSGYEDCVAVTEVAVRMKAGPPTGGAPAAPLPAPVSLVALMPQEKTYNAESISNSERSIGGSAVAKVLTLDFSGKRGTRQLFIHRDSDTLAFERNSCAKPALLADATVFGWEFRPVLGRRTVSAGTRQMLAVIAVPKADKDSAEEFFLEIKTQSYWRRYDRKRQTSAPNWSWLPWKVDCSATVQSALQELPIPNTAKIQSALAPKVTAIEWVNSGEGKATVIVKGRSFFSGTKVVIGGVVHREEDGTLTLKSDQALEFETTIDSLATGDAVLSGRFGPSLQLTVPEDQFRADSLYISRATIRPLRKSRAFRISIDIAGLDVGGNPTNLTVKDLEKLPDPILFIGTEAVAMPYDYYDQKDGPVLSAAAGVAAPPSNYVRVEAWISAKALAKSPSVSFRVPFCGFNYQSSQPLSFSEPTAVRMGSNTQNNLQTTVFRIFYPQGFGSPTVGSFSIELDRTYFEGDPAIFRTSDTEYRFSVPTDIVSRYQNMVVRMGSAEPYLLPIPPEDKPLPKATIDPTAKPPQVAKGKRGPVEWTGSALDTIAEVTFTPTILGVSTTTPVPQQFTTYAGGKRLLVYLSKEATDSEGKVTLECTTSASDKLNLPVFVTAT